MNPRDLRLPGAEAPCLHQPLGLSRPKRSPHVAPGGRTAGGRPRLSARLSAFATGGLASRRSLRRRTPSRSASRRSEWGRRVVCLAARPAFRVPLRPRGLRLPRSRSPLRGLGRSPGSLASSASTAWSEADSTGGLGGGSTSRSCRPEHIPAGQRARTKSDKQDAHRSCSARAGPHAAAFSSRYTPSISSAEVSHVNRSASRAARSPRFCCSTGSRRIRSIASA